MPSKKRTDSATVPAELLEKEGAKIQPWICPSCRTLNSVVDEPLDLGGPQVRCCQCNGWSDRIAVEWLKAEAVDGAEG